MNDCEFAYAGNYLCWKPHNKSLIHVANIKELKQNAELGKNLFLKGDRNSVDVNSRVIDLSEYVKPGSEHLVTIESCDIGPRLKQNQESLFDQRTRCKVGNSLQITIENRILIIYLGSENLQPIEDHEAIDQLLDPQLHVEFGVQLSVVTEKHSKVKENKTY